MDGFKVGKGRVTTDAVHRRFRTSKREKTKDTNENGKSDEDDYYYCKQCMEKINAFPGKEKLMAHFETIRHNPYSSCVYCSKPVYEYTYKKRQEIYHLCRYD